MKYDINEIRSLLKAECTNCIEINKCSNCPFQLGWLYHSYEIYTGPKFNKFNINRIYKHYLYYFLSHPELEFKFPELPKYDKLGNSDNDGILWRWEIHHKDGNHRNDEEFNLELLLFTEHRSIHWYQSNPMWNQNSKECRLKIQDELIKQGKHNFQNGNENSFWLNDKYDESRKSRKIHISNSLKQLSEQGKHYSQTGEFKSTMSKAQTTLVTSGNHVFQDPERMRNARLLTSKRNLDKIAKGTHSFQFENNNCPNINKKKSLISYLSNLNETITINKEFMLERNYSDWYSFLHSIKLIIDQYNLKDLKFDRSNLIIKYLGMNLANSC